MPYVFFGLTVAFFAATASSVAGLDDTPRFGSKYLLHLAALSLGALGFGGCLLLGILCKINGIYTLS